jgi:hypothetical protein
LRGGLEAVQRFGEDLLEFVAVFGKMLITVIQGPPWTGWRGSILISGPG